MGKANIGTARAVACLAAAVLAACATPAQRPPAALPPPADAASGAAPEGPAPPAAPDAGTPPAAPRDDLSADVTVPAPEKPLPRLADPRTPSQRMDDIRAWDKCVLAIQRRGEDEVGRVNPVAESPEEYCRRTLGMPSRTAVPYRRQ